MLPSELSRCGPGLAGRLVINADRQSVERPGQALPFRPGNAIAAFCGEQAVDCLNRPKLRRHGAGLGQATQDGHDGRGLFAFEAPSEGDRVVENEAHRRPSLTNSLIDNPSSVRPLLARTKLSAA